MWPPTRTSPGRTRDRASSCIRRWVPRGTKTSRSLAIRRPAIHRPAKPMASRYAARQSMSGPVTPITRSRSRTTPWYSGVHSTMSATTRG